MMFTAGSRAVIIRQALSAWTCALRGVKAAGLLDPRPGEAQGAELRQGDELVRVGREAEGDHAARLVERNAHGLERAQESDAGGEREGELLARRAARRMNASRVRDEIRSGVAPDASDSATSR